jgi:hypothetical protein
MNRRDFDTLLVAALHQYELRRARKERNIRIAAGIVVVCLAVASMVLLCGVVQ